MGLETEICASLNLSRDEKYYHQKAESATGRSSEKIKVQRVMIC